MGTTSSNSYGYFGGGDNFTNLISRVDFTNETVSNPGKNLPTSNMTSSGTSSSFYGYFGGGFLTPPNAANYISTISRLDFSSETISNPGNNLPSARSRMAAVSNSN
jgi:hypothetical protein